MPRHRQYLLLLVAIPWAHLPGCTHDGSTAELSRVYRTGMTRAEAADSFGKPTRVATRAAEGWTRQDGTAEHFGTFAGDFEHSRGTTVQTCEVRTVPRGAFGIGIYWDYLFYDPDDWLLGFHRRFLD